MAKRVRGRHFIITVNGERKDVKKAFRCYSEKIKEYYPERIWNTSGQLEKGEESKKLHAQIYIGFKDPEGKKIVDEILGTTAYHLEGCRSPKASWNYCKKEDTRVGAGVSFPWRDNAQGKRTDIENAIENLQECDGIIKNMDAEHIPTYVKFHSGFDKVARLIINEKRSVQVQKKEVIVHWGVAGAGKTYSARQAGATSVQYRNGFFRFNEESDIVVFDEADKMDINEEMWLKLLDNYPLEVNVKGGWAIFNPTKIYITSNLDPQYWLTVTDALKRRITTVIEFKEVWNTSGL